MNEIKRKSAKIGVYFFSIFLILQFFFQGYNVLNNKEFQLAPILYTFVLILICKYYYKFEDFLKKRNWS